MPRSARPCSRHKRHICPEETTFTGSVCPCCGWSTTKCPCIGFEESLRREQGPAPTKRQAQAIAEGGNPNFACEACTHVHGYDVGDGADVDDERACWPCKKCKGGVCHGLWHGPPSCWPEAQVIEDAARRGAA